MQVELAGGLVDGVLDAHPLGVDLLEVEVVEEDLERALAAGEALHGGDRVAAVRPQRKLAGERLPDQVPPRPGGARVVGERKRVQVHAVHPVGAGHLGPAVADQTAGEDGLAGELAHHLQVRGEQHALERRPGAGGQVAQAVHEVVHGHAGAALVLGDGLVLAPAAGQLEAGQGDDAPPVVLVLRGLQRLQLAGDEVGVPDRQRRERGRLAGVPHGAVVVQDLHEQRVVAPAFEDAVRHREDEPPRAVVADHRGDPHLRRLLGREGAAALGRHVRPQRVLGVSGKDGDLDRHGGVYELHRHREAVEGEGGAQDLVPLHDRAHGAAQHVRGELVGVADRERGDVVVRAPLLVGHRHDEHAELDLAARVRVHDAGRHQGAVGGADQRERRDGTVGRLGGRRVPLLDVGGERRDRAVPEDVLDADAEPGAAQRADERDRADRVAAEVEEGVVRPDRVALQDPRPDAGDPPLQVGAGRDVDALVRDGEREQRLAVDLPVGVERDRVDRHQVGRDQVVRQGAGERGAHLVRPPRRPGPVAGEPLVAVGLLAHEHRRVADAGQRAERGLDLAQLDPEAPDLHLVVDPAAELHRAAGQPVREVAGAVEAGAGRAERVRHELAGGQLGRAGVPAGHAHAADVQLADHADRRRPQPGVQHEHRHPGQRPADRHDRRRLLALDGVDTGADGRLGRAVLVDEVARTEQVEPPVGQRGGQPFAGDDHDRRQRGERLVRQLPPHDLQVARRHLEEGVRAGGGQGRAQLGQVEVLVDHDHPLAGGERRPQVRHLQVERDRREDRRTAGAAPGQDARGPADVVGQAPVGHLHALGTAGGAGREDHVGQVVEVGHAGHRAAFRRRANRANRARWAR
ncbi:hypothetical protein GCM10027575_27410 [Phytohabitans suffuscus]